MSIQIGEDIVIGQAEAEEEEEGGGGDAHIPNAVVEVFTEADFGTAVGDVIALTPGVTYELMNNIFTDKRFDIAGSNILNSVGIRSNHRFSDGLYSTGSGDHFFFNSDPGGDVGLIIQNIFIASTLSLLGGRGFMEFKALTQINSFIQLDACTISGFYNGTDADGIRATRSVFENLIFLLENTTRWFNSNTVVLIDAILSVSGGSFNNAPETANTAFSISSKNPLVGSQVTLDQVAIPFNAMEVHSNLNPLSSLLINNLFSDPFSTGPKGVDVFFNDGKGIVSAVAEGVGVDYSDNFFIVGGVGGQDDSPTGMAFSNDGMKMFMVGNSSAAVYEYDLPVRLGRNYGIGVSLISQRPQSVNKEVLNQVECLFVLQTNGVHERKAIKDWISYQGFDVDLVAELPQLPIGEAYVWSPQWLNICGRYKIGKKKTFDASATPTFNGKTVAPRKLEKPEMSALNDAMSDIVEKKEANDPRLLRKEIQKLRKQLESRNGASPDEIKEAVDKAIMEDRQRWEKVLDRYHKRVMFHFDAAKNEPLRPPDKRGFFPKDKKTTQSIPKIIPQKSRVEVNPDIELPKGARRMAEELVAIHPRIVNKKQLATIVGMKSSGGTYSNYMSILRKGGFLHENGNGMFCASEMAREMFSSVESVPTTHEGIVLFWKGKIPAGAFKILNVLIEHYDRSLTKQEIAEQVDMAVTGGTFSNYLSILVTNGLADRVGPGELKASDNLFPERQQ